MVEVTERDLQPGDIDALLGNLRKCDQLEVEASAGKHRVALVLRLAERSSLWARTIFVNDKLTCIFGVSSIDFVQGVGSPWMLATPVFDKHPRAVIERSAGYIPLIQELFPHLINYVDARNVKAIKWLKWLGFDMHPAVPYGFYNMPFHKFEMKASHV